ncbi:MAG: hypothetical protein EA408_09965 [Marinilabiliales bacterium]|nr:MAG: hypothetical protein EA408_09965 [Marinilabiliales bacterium]
MQRLFYFFTALTMLIAVPVGGQVQPAVGLRDNTPSVYVITNATIVVSPGKVIENGTMVVRNGIIEAVGSSVRPPADAWVRDLEGKTIYPGFIDLWSETGFPDPDEAGRRQARVMNIPAEYAELAAQLLGQSTDQPEVPGAIHWNPQVRSWFDASSAYTYDEDRLKRYRSSGFVLANAVPPAGIFRGKSVLVSLGEGDNTMLVVKPDVAQAMSFQRSRGLGGRYPTSLMGVISLIRQTFYDAQWYQNAHAAYNAAGGGLERPETNLALGSLVPAGNGLQPVIFDTGDEIGFMRALSISHEFGLNLWARGSGYEYRRLDVIRDAGVPVILPLNFPDTPDVESPESAMNVSLEDLRHWDLAPENPGRLSNAGIKIALTGSGLGSNTSFLDNLRVAVERGLDQDAALEALTLTPAIMLGVERHYGSLERGKTASFIVADGNIFERSVKVEEVWIDGKPYEITETGKTDLRGKWKAEIDGIGEVEIDISGTDRRLRGKLNLDDKSVDLLRVSTDNHRVTIGFRGDSIGVEGIVRLSASVTEKELYGIGEMPDGKFINWKAARLSDHEEARNDDTRRPAGMSELTMLYPSMEYGFEKRPDMHDNVVVRNATIWTQGPAGKLENADLYVRRGRIVEVGRGLDVPRGAVVIDGTGKHVTPGLVDPHLHSSIRGGVNEVGNNMTPETRITDVIEPDNIWVYRLLAGGMTTANLLHGSANPVGGQDAVVKMRWGALPDEMLLEGAKPGLKLALGENVVRNSNQYPNTRMGAEQIIRDAFQATKDYMARWENWEREKSGIPPRKDLQLEAMAEVLRGERIIHAHAYRQDEMQMLMRLAEDMGFRIATFEHTVEGYKIADILREHGAGAIIWTDWSSFKVEAADGILYNARILLDQGVHTALHSDNTQLSTRMNWEAGKMLATGIDEIAAMDLITINPAKMIGIDEMVGSLEPGKHADFVIWNGHPLSGFTHAEQTWVDGRKYFDREQDMLLREEVRVERAALIQKAAAASDNQGSGDQAARRTSGHN